MKKALSLSKSGSRLWPDPWSLMALMISLVVLAPIVAVGTLAVFPSENIWPHLLATTLPRYLGTTLVLMAGVGLFAALVGTGAAWLIARYEFPLSRWLEWLLLLPLAVPAYVGAYALVDLLEYAGPVQTALRAAFGWQTAQDYWFPEIRSLGSAIVVLAAALYPYVYLLARAAFHEQSGASEEVAMSLGQGALQRLRRIGLPLARPAVAAGTAIVMMEAVNDFGTVDYFAVQTLTTGIFSTWLEGNNAGGAAQIACVVLVLVIFLVTLEKVSRRKARFFNQGGRHRPILRKRLRGGWALLATLGCVLPFAVGFLIPAGTILSHALARVELWAEPALYKAAWNTVVVGSLAAFLTVTGGLLLVYGVRLSGRSLPRLLQPITTIGYAAPGAVLAVGILLPLATLDNAMADFVLGVTGFDPGLILTGSSFALVLAYFVRFFAIGQGAADAALERVAPSLSMAARSLGRRQGQVLTEIYMPLIKGSVGSALLLVFVDCVKELPATLLLRPFNYDTLATRVHDQASLENLSDAAPAAIFIIVVSLFAVILLARANRTNF
ncbi:iron ABC transporter permease [uncultured Lentibacter sp.]|uniref:ABC transporter permease n=1 Tax=uncultured Lentibacter sp. TaxID=1659309 RepID=UPI00260CA1B3|nr:iron ABC transporter permease [uncultured Lentibacter sp.]